MGTTTTTSIPTTNSLDSPRNGNSAGQSPRTQGDGSSNGASTNSPSPRQDSYYSGHAPRSTFKTSQELQTFHPPTRNSNAIKQSGSRDILPQQGTSSRNPREAGLGSRDARSHGPATTKDWRNDSFATTDDCDDQRSTTTTSGSYTIDNEDTYVGLHDLNHSPWKDVVV
nr:hypothetical protein BaRGS_023239 [Batillaria attramentaria]